MNILRIASLTGAGLCSASIALIIVLYARSGIIGGFYMWRVDEYLQWARMGLAVSFIGFFLAFSGRGWWRIALVVLGASELFIWYGFGMAI